MRSCAGNGDKPLEQCLGRLDGERTQRQKVRCRHSQPCVFCKANLLIEPWFAWTSQTPNAHGPPWWRAAPLALDCARRSRAACCWGPTTPSAAMPQSVRSRFAKGDKVRRRFGSGRRVFEIVCVSFEAAATTPPPPPPDEDAAPDLAGVLTLADRTGLSGATRLL